MRFCVMPRIGKDLVLHVLALIINTVCAGFWTMRNMKF